MAVAERLNPQYGWKKGRFAGGFFTWFMGLFSQIPRHF
jgi:hypothetical protein